MKLKLITLAIPAIFAASSAFAAEGESSTVNFTGSVVETSCSLSAGSKGQTVPMGDVAANVFTGAGTTSQERPFSITLEGCDIAANPGSVSIVFSGNAVSGKDDTLATSAVATTKVGLQILQAGAPLVIDGSTASAGQTMVDGSNELAFSARYIALDNSVAAGDANASANFTVNYQ